MKIFSFDSPGLFPPTVCTGKEPESGVLLELDFKELLDVEPAESEWFKGFSKIYNDAQMSLDGFLVTSSEGWKFQFTCKTLNLGYLGEPGLLLTILPENVEYFAR